MTEDELKQLEELVKAGEKARKGEWRSVMTDLECVPGDNLFFVDNYTGAIWDENGLCCSLDSDFISLAANARPLIKKLLEENKALKDRLEISDDHDIDGIEARDETIRQITKLIDNAISCQKSPTESAEE